MYLALSFLCFIFVSTSDWRFRTSDWRLALACSNDRNTGTQNISEQPGTVSENPEHPGTPSRKPETPSKKPEHLLEKAEEARKPLKIP